MFKHEGEVSPKTPLSPQPSFPIAWRKREQSNPQIHIYLKGVLSSELKGEGVKTLLAKYCL
jgi:hypothetical protein